MEQKAIVEISFSGKNFGAHVPQLPGCVATGKTPDDVKQRIKEAIEFHLEGMREDNDPIPKAFRSDYQLTFKFDPQSFFQWFKGVFSNAGLERVTGINQKQLQHYASGLKKPRQAQTKKIETALHNLGAELMAVEL